MTGIGCLSGLMIDQGRLLLIFTSFALAVVVFAVLKSQRFSLRSRTVLTYTHLTLLFFPFVLFSTHMGCGMMCMPCQDNLLRLISYALPTTLVASTLAGFVAIPALYIVSGKKMVIEKSRLIDFLKKHSAILNIKTPRLYAMDDARPYAFSFRSFISAIFMSVGLLDIMNEKETRAVLLHELAHIRQKSSILKFSNSILRVFSPLSLLTRFHHDSGKDEKEADEFVIRMQGTDRYLLSAKSKLNSYKDENA